jgi:hypothetical protein
MFERIRRRLSFANVVSLLALFFALGGSAYAAFIVNSNSDVASGTISGHAPPAGDHSNLIAASVNAQDLKGGAVNSAKIANGQVLAPDLGVDYQLHSFDQAITTVVGAGTAKLPYLDIGGFSQISANHGGLIDTSVLSGPNAYVVAVADLTLFSGPGGGEFQCQLFGSSGGNPAVPMSDPVYIDVSDSAEPGGVEDATLAATGGAPFHQGLTDVSLKCMPDIGSIKVDGGDLQVWAYPTGGRP